MTILNKEERKTCWDSRDRYWACLDQSESTQTECLHLRKLCEHVCPSQWMQHFDRKRQYAELRKKIFSLSLEPPSPSQPTSDKPKRHQRPYRSLLSV